MSKIRSLNDRFHDYLKSLPSGELIDSMDLSWYPRGKQKADFFLNNREIICEIKRIKNDPLYKLDEAIDQLQNRDDWPIIMGAARPLNSIIQRFPDRDGIIRKINDKHTRSIEKSVQDANNQIRDTKETFNLPNAGGILILLNEDVHSLTPNEVAYRVSTCLLKVTSPDRLPRFPFVSAVMVVDKSHLQIEGENTFSFPIFSVANPNSNMPKVNEVVNELMEGWPRFDGFDAIRTEWGNMDLNFIGAVEIP